jgi:hypothetical protein
MKTLFLALLVATAPLHAQAGAGPATAAAPLPPVAPDRLAAARHVVDSIWPIGTYARVMQRSLNGVMDMMVGNAFGLPLDEARKKDPYFDERFKITMDTMMGEMVKLMARYEPDIREGLTEAYARKFDVAQLEDLQRFFATPTGAAYAAESMTLMTDPAIMKRMQAVIPDLLKSMPAIMEKTKAATAHLPPPPAQRPEKEGEKQ